VALTGRGFDGIYAKAIGLISAVYEDGVAIDAACDALLGDILRCAPSAVAATKALLLRVGNEPIAPLMRDAANVFAAAARGPEGREGVAAFLEKRSPMWSVRASTGTSSASWATPG
jgi:isohexenylglutaconyl-CoA hydratase